MAEFLQAVDTCLTGVVHQDLNKSVMAAKFVFLLSEIDQAKWLCEQPARFADFREWLRDDSTHWTMEDLVQDSPTWKEVNFATMMRGTMQLHQKN